jgi:hypothetical protein
MQVTTADLWQPQPGRVLRWQVSSNGRGAAAALSFHQRNHLAAAAAGSSSVWLAAAFDVTGPIDPVALEQALRTFVARHSSLQLEVLREQMDSVGVRHRADTLTWSWSSTQSETHSVEHTRALLQAALTEGCHPFGYPAFAPVAISRAQRSTIILGMDHLHCDAYSITIVIDELAALYDARKRGSQARLPDAACFLTQIQRDEQARARISPDDPRLLTWHAYLRERQFALPTFPLPLGVAPGARAAQATIVCQLLDAEAMTQISLLARGLNSSTYASVLAALAKTLRVLGGPRHVDTLLPVALRDDAAVKRSVGWYTTSVPVSIDADVSETGLSAAGRAVSAALTLASVPLSEVLAALPAPLVQTRSDVFMVSWIDYRHLPGAALAAIRNAQHISAPTQADDLQLWLSRTERGLDVRARIPDTPIARATLHTALNLWSYILHELAARGRRTLRRSYPLTATPATTPIVQHR